MIVGLEFRDLKKLKKIFSAKSRWPLDDKAPFMKGPGLKL